jgi:HEAT repeat protein
MSWTALVFGQNPKVDHVVRLLEEGRIDNLAEAEALGSQSVPALVDALKRSQDSKRTCLLIRSLGAIRSDAAVRPICDALQQAARKDRPAVEWCATEALGQIGSPGALRSLLNIARSTGSQDAAFVQQVLPQSIASVSNTEVAVVFVEELTRDNGLFDLSFSRLAAIGATGAVPHIVPFLHNKSPELRASAARALYSLGGADAKSSLRQVLDEEPDPTVRTLVAGALVKAGDTQARSQLKTLASAGELQSRCLAIQMLGEMPDGFDQQFFQDLAFDNDPIIREYTVHALSKHTDPKAMALLKTIAQHDDFVRVRQTAQEALKAIKGD